MCLIMKYNIGQKNKILDFFSISTRDTLSGPWFNIKMLSYQHRKSHCGYKIILRLSYLHNGISHTGKMASLYWFGVLIVVDKMRKDELVPASIVEDGDRAYV